MIVCVDVDYQDADGYAVCACVGFEEWSDAVPAASWRSQVSLQSAYTPGAFYERELPCILTVLDLARRDVSIETIVIDAYVWLSADMKPGLGARLHVALNAEVAVIGVAKNRFDGAPAIEVRRGAGDRPLFVSAVGVDAVRASEFIRGMHGAFRIPTLLKCVDQLARAPARERAAELRVASVGERAEDTEHDRDGG